MLKIKNKNIYLNRGDSASIQLTCNNGVFLPGDIVKFYIVEQNNYENILFSSSTTVNEETNSIEIRLNSQDTKIGDPLKSGFRTYWYEVELISSRLEDAGTEQEQRIENVTTLVGYDEDGPKLFILYPEAIEGGN